MLGDMKRFGLLLAVLSGSLCSTSASFPPFLGQRQNVPVIPSLSATKTTKIISTLRGGGGGGAKRALPAAISGGQEHHVEELMSPVTAVANVLADLCPHGMLPLAYGVAAAGGTGLLLATITLLFFGFLSWYSLLSFGRGADLTLESTEDGESLSAVWSRTVPNGEKTAYIPDLGCFLLTVGCCLFYSAFIGDLFGSLASGILPKSVPDVFKSRSTVLLLLHAVPILPLCLLKDLSALKYSSMTGLAGIVYTLFFVGKRMVDGTYDEGGKFYDLMPKELHPADQIHFPRKEGNVGVGHYITDMPLFHVGRGMLIFMNMCCVAFACHYNAVKYYMELKDRTVRTFGNVMATGVAGTAIVFLGMMILGYGTFGANSQALILNNYHDSDAMAGIARFFTGLAIISGYPLMFSGLKASMFALAKLDKKGVENRERKQNTLSVIMLAAIATGACFVREHELATVIGIVGSVFGSVVIYMLPAFVNNGLLKKTLKDKPLAKPFFKGEQVFNNILVVFGIIFAVLGTWVSIAGEGEGSHH